jgi:hypothetical protein
VNISLDLNFCCMGSYWITSCDTVPLIHLNGLYRRMKTGNQQAKKLLNKCNCSFIKPRVFWDSNFQREFKNFCSVFIIKRILQFLLFIFSQWELLHFFKEMFAILPYCVWSSKLMIYSPPVSEIYFPFVSVLGRQREIILQAPGLQNHPVCILSWQTISSSTVLYTQNTTFYLLLSVFIWFTNKTRNKKQIINMWWSICSNETPFGVKGTVSRDFRPSVFFPQTIPPGSLIHGLFASNIF